MKGNTMNNEAPGRAQVCASLCAQMISDTLATSLEKSKIAIVLSCLVF